MKNLFTKWGLTCAAATVFLCVLATPSSAGVMIDAYYQQVGVNGYYPDGTNYNESYITGPLSTSAVSGYANITSSTVSSTRIDMSYSLGLSIDTAGNAFALQLVDFHVETETSYTFNISAFPAHGLYDYNVGGIYSKTTSQYDFYHYVTDGSEFTVTGIFLPGQNYQYISQTQIIFDQAFSGGITGHSSLTTVPEPPTFTVFGLGGLGLAFIRFRQRRAAAVV